MNIQKFTFMLTEEQRSHVEKESARRNRIIGYVVRELIDGAIEERKEDHGDVVIFSKKFLL